VLAEACRTVQAWAAAYPGQPPLTVSVNLSARQFGSPRLAEEIADTLRETGLAPRQLCLEITESVMMADTAGTLGTLRTLRELGVRLAIDDFGTGYSSLSYLKDFPVDVVKIDRSFVREIGQRRADTAIVAAVVRLAEALGMDVVAEGVETCEQRARLNDLGCSIMQGYLFSPPCAAEQFVEFWTGDPIAVI
jgi:EAL domain-containing protein (putative c-di-GMP-specific phosphodiesterase class I)